MAEKKVINGRGIARKLIEEQNEKMRRLLIKEVTGWPRRVKKEDKQT